MTKSLSEYRFPVQYVEIVEQFLANYGISSDQVRQRIGFIESEKSGTGGVIDGNVVQRMFSLCAEYADKNIPLSAQLLKQFPVTAHGILGIVVLTSPTLNYALNAALRFYPLVLPTYSIHKEEVGDQIHLVFEPLVDFGEISPAITETVLGAFNSIQSYVGANHVMLEMHFKHSSRFPSSAYNSFADEDKIVFDQPFNKIILPKSQLNYPITTANKVTMTQFECELEKQIQRFSRQLSMSKRVADMLSEKMKTGLKVTLDNAAEFMHLSPRTLSRRLAEEETSFNQLAMDAKLAHADFLLLNTDKTIAQIAYATGFSNESSFSRAFKKARGMSPREFRSQDQNDINT